MITPTIRDVIKQIRPIYEQPAAKLIANREYAQRIANMLHENGGISNANIVAIAEKATILKLHDLFRVS